MWPMAGCSATSRIARRNRVFPGCIWDTPVQFRQKVGVREHGLVRAIGSWDKPVFDGTHDEAD